MTMDPDNKEALREANRRRGNCPLCGGRTSVIDGSELDQTCHFSGIKYKVCGACGYETVTRSKR